MDEFDKADAYLGNGEGERAMSIFHRLAEQGRLDAMHSIAHTYLYGIAGVRQDYDKAFAWFTRAANNGCPQAMYHLGMCNAKGYGTPVDNTAAAAWYRKSADHGDEDAMYELGNCYEKGLGVTADMEAARKWYRKAAGYGQANAAELLRRMDA